MNEIVFSRGDGFQTPVRVPRLFLPQESPQTPHNTPQGLGSFSQIQITPSFFRTPRFGFGPPTALISPGNGSNQIVPCTPVKSIKPSMRVREVPQMPNVEFGQRRSQILQARSPWTPGSSLLVPQIDLEQVMQNSGKNRKVKSRSNDDDNKEEDEDGVVPNVDLSTLQKPSKLTRVDETPPPPVKRRRRRYLVDV